MEFADRQSLRAWLGSQGVETSNWGHSRAKSLANLWQEYLQGEIRFAEDPPTRQVRVVQVILRRDGRVLHELAQQFADGRVRRRELPPSEKIIASESAVAAAERCLREELGLERERILDLEQQEALEIKVADSPSYPGLRTQYTVHTVEATVEGLPGDDFWRDNRAALSGDPVQRHLWGWR